MAARRGAAPGAREPQPDRAHRGADPRPARARGLRQRELADYVRRLCTSGAFPKAGAFDADTSDPTQPRPTSSTPPPLQPRPNLVAVTRQPTPGPTVRALLPSPTFPSIERRPIQGPIVAGGFALALGRPRGRRVPRRARVENPTVDRRRPGGADPRHATEARERFAIGAALTSVGPRRLHHDVQGAGHALLHEGWPDGRVHAVLRALTTGRDGLTLRARCKGGPTITVLVVQPSHGPVRHLAAYAEVPLDGKGWGKDPHALLYGSIATRSSRCDTCRRPSQTPNSTFGPTFGAGHDLHVAPSLLRGMSGPRSFLLVANEAEIVGHFGFFRGVASSSRYSVARARRGAAAPRGRGSSPGDSSGADRASRGCAARARACAAVYDPRPRRSARRATPPR